MSRIPATAHDRAAVLAKGRRIAAGLAAEARDPASPLRWVDRLALATLALAVDVEASRLVGVEPLTAEARAQLAEALARIEADEATGGQPGRCAR